MKFKNLDKNLIPILNIQIFGKFRLSDFMPIPKYIPTSFKILYQHLYLNSSTNISVQQRK